MPWFACVCVGFSQAPPPYPTTVSAVPPQQQNVVQQSAIGVFNQGARFDSGSQPTIPVRPVGQTCTWDWLLFYSCAATTSRICSHCSTSGSSSRTNCSHGSREKGCVGIWSWWWLYYHLNRFCFFIPTFFITLFCTGNCMECCTCMPTLGRRALGGGGETSARLCLCRIDHYLVRMSLDSSSFAFLILVFLSVSSTQVDVPVVCGGFVKSSFQADYTRVKVSCTQLATWSVVQCHRLREYIFYTAALATSSVTNSTL